MKQNELEQIISYQKKSLDLITRELEKVIELEKKANSGLVTAEEELEWAANDEHKREENQ